METFKAWKELIKAVKGISSAIEGENSEGGSGEVDNINYIDNGGRFIINKTFDASKLSFDVSTPPAIIEKVGDLFNQEGVDIINSMLPIVVNDPATEFAVFIFIKDSPIGNAVFDLIHLQYEKRMTEFVMRDGAYAGRVSDKFTLDTPLIKNAQH